MEKLMMKAKLIGLANYLDSQMLMDFVIAMPMMKATAMHSVIEKR